MLEGVKIRILAMACALMIVAVAGCSSDTSEPKASTPTTVATTEPPAPILSPLTGEEVSALPDNPVFVVKIDNTQSSAPQENVDQADLVVEETVEGGITRLAALFYSTLPEQVGHVRSMRATDIGIAKPVAGQVVASGGAGVTIGRIKKAGIPIFSQDAGDAGFWRGSGYAPYNVLVDLTKIAAKAKVSEIENPYFEWDAEATAPTGTPVTSAGVRFSRSHATQWAFADGTWKRTNGTGDKEFAAKNLIVLFADERDAGYTDPAGNPVPETVFEGTGRAVMFLGGQVVEGTWTKSDLDSTVQLKTKDGAAVALSPGKVWIELVDKGAGHVAWE